MGRKSVGELIEEFAFAVVAQSDAIMAGSSKLSNAAARRQIKAFERIRALGDDAREAMMVLLEHPRPDVRAHAAVCLLRYNTARARAVLEELARGQSLTASEARLALKGWDEGTLALDPE